MDRQCEYMDFSIRFPKSRRVFLCELTVFDIDYFLSFRMMMLRSTTRSASIFKWSPCKGSFTGTKVEPTLADFISIAPFQGHVTGILSLDTEIRIDNPKQITPLIIAAHNLKTCIVGILLAFL